MYCMHIAFETVTRSQNTLLLPVTMTLTLIHVPRDAQPIVLIDGILSRKVPLQIVEPFAHNDEAVERAAKGLGIGVEEVSERACKDGLLV